MNVLVRRNRLGQSKFENEVKVQYFDGFNKGIVSVETKLGADSVIIKSHVLIKYKLLGEMKFNLIWLMIPKAQISCKEL